MPLSAIYRILMLVIRAYYLQHELVNALTADDNGLAALTHIITHAPIHSHKNRWLCVEHGYTQAPNICDLLHERGFININTLTDLCSNPRVTIGMWPTQSVNNT